MGLKAGGTARQRAERLMLLRDTPLHRLDRKHFAKGVIPAVSGCGTHVSPAVSVGILELTCVILPRAAILQRREHLQLRRHVCTSRTTPSGSLHHANLSCCMLKTTHDMVQEAQSEAEKAKQTAAAKEAAGLEAQVGRRTVCLFAPGVLAACNWPGFTAT